MATEIRVPTLGESVSEATIGRWFKKPGDPVKADEPAASSSRPTRSPSRSTPPPAGTLGDIIAKDGETVGARRGARLHRRGRRRRRSAGPCAEGRGSARPLPPRRAPAACARSRRSRLPRTRETAPPSTRIAAESGVDPGGVAGTGKDGRVTKGDMLAADRDGRRRGSRAARLPSRCARPPLRSMPRAKSA